MTPVPRDRLMGAPGWLIDLGPGAGQDGGRVIFTGTPAELISSGDTLTAQALRKYLTSASKPAA